MEHSLSAPTTGGNHSPSVLFAAESTATAAQDLGIGMEASPFALPCLPGGLESGQQFAAAPFGGRRLAGLIGLGAARSSSVLIRGRGSPRRSVHPSE